MQLELGLMEAEAEAASDAAGVRAADEKRRDKGRHGGWRPGAGRKKDKNRRDPLHRTRPEFAKRFAQHIVLRARADVGRLRRGPIYRALRRALQRQLGKLGFQVCHLSIQRNHLHFLVEAAGKDRLRHGMQSLAITAAKAINRTLKRKGKVFQYRYHATSIRTPRQARNALAYVLNNWRRHNEDESARAARFAAIDPYSTARQFTGWAERTDAVMPPGFKAFQPLEVAPPRTWLLAEGWKKAGTISCWATPGPLPTR